MPHGAWFIFVLEPSRFTSPKLLQLAWINNGDHQKIVEEMKLNEGPDDKVNCLGFHDKMNQNRIAYDQWMLNVFESENYDSSQCFSRIHDCPVMVLLAARILSSLKERIGSVKRGTTWFSSSKFSDSRAVAKYMMYLLHAYMSGNYSLSLTPLACLLS